LAIKGEGGIIMQKENGETEFMEMKPGALIYVAPYWAHRTINTSNSDFTFLAVYPANAGHDYGTIEEKGFRKVVVELDGLPTVGDNPKWK
jgi:glucose-6-phosphate isomerase